MYSLSGYGVYFSPEFKQKSPLRIVSQYEIELISHSKADGFVDGEKFHYEKDRVYLYTPGQQRQSLGNFQAYYLHFSCSDPEVRKYLDSLPNFLPRGNTQPIYRLFNDIFNAMAYKQPGYKLLASAKITEMIALLYDLNAQAATADGKYSAYTPEIYDAVHYMQTHLSEHITLEHIASKVHLSPSFFHVTFKNIVGITPHRYLLNLRLGTAKSLLTNSNLSLAVIAEQSGFDSQVYFNYIIKKELGVTPKQYRDAHRNKHYL